MMAAATATWEGLVGLDSEVARLRRGDPGAFDALLARYQNRLYRYLNRLVREPAAAGPCARPGLPVPALPRRRA